MKKFILSAIIILTSIFHSHGQWTKIPLPSDYSIAQMQFVNDSTGYIIADSIMGLSLIGKVFKTTDKGLTWNEQNFYFASFDYMHFINPDTGWISMSDGTNGFVRRTYDGGNTWINVSFNAPHGPVYFVSATEGYIGGIAAGPNGAALFKTLNGGVSWTNTGINLGITALQDMLFTNSITAFAGGL